jgi:MOSC domain-containing protein YiiM
VKLVSVNLGQREILPSPAYTKPTGILKRPVSSASVTRDGVNGDFVADQKHHGGPDQAVYVYTTPDYDFWTAELGDALQPGTFGDNLTLSGLESAALRAGDRLRVGSVMFEVTAPRIPCNTLAARMDDAQFVKRFRAAGRPGAYCRVLEPGTVNVGDAVTLEAATEENPTILELFQYWFEYKTVSRATVERVLAAPVAVRYRKEFEALLEQVAPD